MQRGESWVYWCWGYASCSVTQRCAVAASRHKPQRPWRRQSRGRAAAKPLRTPDVIYVPTPPEVVDEMLRMAKIRPWDVLYDLGSGDGRIAIAAARQYGIRAVGIDIDPQRIAEANENARAAGVANKVRFILGDLFQADISEATVVTLYLLDSLNEKLRPKLLRELQPRTRIVSHAFRMGDWQPQKRPK